MRGMVERSTVRLEPSEGWRTATVEEVPELISQGRTAEEALGMVVAAVHDLLPVTEGWWTATVEEVPELISQGRTAEEALGMVVAAVHDLLPVTAPGAAPRPLLEQIAAGRELVTAA